MRVTRNVPSLLLALITGLAGSSAAVAQEERGTFQQQMACTPDVFRLCGDLIPDASRITACLRQNAPRLSQPCHAVFEANASVEQPQQLAPGDRYYRPRRYGDYPSADGYDR